MKILIIEDDKETINIVKAILELKMPTAEVISNSSGMAGIELVRQNSPDIVLLDLGLPDTDGFQVIQSIRKFSNVPLCVITARDGRSEEEKSLKLGANDFITKPFSPNDLITRLRKFLN